MEQQGEQYLGLPFSNIDEMSSFCKKVIERRGVKNHHFWVNEDECVTFKKLFEGQELENGRFSFEGLCLSILGLDHYPVMDKDLTYFLSYGYTKTATMPTCIGAIKYFRKYINGVEFMVYVKDNKVSVYSTSEIGANRISPNIIIEGQDYCNYTELSYILNSVVK